MSSPQMRTRRLAVGAAVGVVALISTVVTVAGPAGAVPGFELTRIEGENRYETAAAIARSSFPGAQVALLANGQEDNPRTARNEEHFPDALAGNYVAGARTAPTLLTTETSLPAVTRDTLRSLGVRTVVIIGGPAAVSTAQEQQLRNEGYTVQRLQGRNRYETASSVARNPGQAYVGSVDGRRTAVVASGAKFPDALVMGPLSYSGKLPLTLTEPQRLPATTRTTLDELDIAHVLIPGGTEAVSTAVENEIKAMGITVQRFPGNVRTDTAKLVAEYALAELGFTDTHVNLALGQRFPDALTGGPHSGKEKAPILLTADVDVLGAATRDYLEDHSDTLEDGHIFGGIAAVSARVEREAEEAGQGDQGPSPSGSATPTGTASPTPTASPTAGPFSCTDPNSTPPGASASPTSSASPTQSATAAPASASASPTASATASASASATASATATSSASPQATVNPTGPATITKRPELEDVEYVGDPRLSDGGTPADSRDDACVVEVRFTFDEPVTGKTPLASNFLLIGYDPATRFTGTSAVREASGTTVLVTFGRGENPTTAAIERRDVGAREIAQVSLAAVDESAVADGSGAANPIGDLPIGETRSVPTFPAGITAAPDLVDVTLTNVAATSTAIRYDFDETVASIVKSTGFHVVTQDGRDVACTAPATSGSTVSATCATTTADPVVRGYVESGTVSDEPAPDGADGNLNPLQAEPVEDADGSIGPDLVSAEFRPGDPDEDDDDQVLYTFDEAVFVGDPNGFVVYQSDTDELTSASATNQSDPTKVLATFDDEPAPIPVVTSPVPALDSAVGASVIEGAVTEAAVTARPNQEDEIAVLNAARNTQTAGRTNGPDLIAVTINQDGPSPVVDFTFDETLTPGETVVTRLVLFNGDGTRIPCRTGVTVDDTVTCTAFGSGPSNPSPTDAVIGTADDGAVADEDGTANPEGVQVTSGGDGSPQQ